MYGDFLVEPSEISDVDSPLVAFPEARTHPRRGTKPGSFKSPRTKRLANVITASGPSPSRGTSAGGQSPDVARIYLSRNRNDTPGRVSGRIPGSGYETAGSMVSSMTHPSGCSYIPSQIPDEMRIVKQVMHREKGENGFLNPETNMWNTIVFPRRFPDAREDVHILEGWMRQHIDDPSAFRASVSSPRCESASLLAGHQLHILELSHSELVRQVSIQCAERGRLMAEVWAMNTDLHNTVIKEQQSVMQGLHRRVLDAVAHSEQIEAQMQLMKKNHEEQVTELMSHSELGKKEKENTAFRRLQQDMLLLERDSKIMESTLADLSVWFPNFHLYSNSILRRLLPDAPLQLDNDKGEDGELLDLPQTRLFKDLKRIEMMELGFTVALEGEEAAGSERGSDRGGSAGARRPFSPRLERGDSERLDRLDSAEEGSIHTPDRQASVRSVTFTDAFVRSSEGSLLSPPGSASSRTGIIAPPSKNMRAIIYENQIQKLAIQDYEMKLKDLEFKSSKKEEELKSQLMALQQQVRSLSSLVAGDDGPGQGGEGAGGSGGGVVTGAGVPMQHAVVIRTPFPEHRPEHSLAEELTHLADVYRGKSEGAANVEAGVARPLTVSTPALISVAEIQRTFQAFFNNFAMEILPWNMVCSQSSARTTLITADTRQAAARGARGQAYAHSSLFDLSLSSMESYMLSQWNLHAKVSVREARDRLRALMWSVMVWLQSSSASYYYSGPTKGTTAGARGVAAAVSKGGYRHENTVISIELQEDLPRTAEENEKGLLLGLSILLGVRYRRPAAVPTAPADSDEQISSSKREKNRQAAAALQAGAAAAKRMVPGPGYPLRDRIYTQVFMACYLALQRYMRHNGKLNSSHVAGSNIMEKAARCPVPTSHVRRALKRVIIVAPPCIFYVPAGAMEEYYRIFKKDSGSDSTTSARVQSGEGGQGRHDEDRQLARRLQEVIDLGQSRPWYFQMPQRRMDKIVADCVTLSYKDAGLSCDAYDVIAVVWDNIAEYHDDIKKALMDLYSFANGVSGGSIAGFMFLSIVTNVLEKSDTLLGPLKASLAQEWISAASVDRLDAEYFALSILRSGALLTGLHPLFENSSDTKAELYMGLRYLYERLLGYESVADAMAQMEAKRQHISESATAEGEETAAADDGSPEGVTAIEGEESEVPTTSQPDGGDGSDEAPDILSPEDGTSPTQRDPSGSTPTAAKRVSRLSTLHVPDIGSLVTRCQMCLDSIFGESEGAGGDVVNGFGGGTVPLSQVYFCYKSLEFLLSHFGPECDYDNMLTLEQEAIAIRFQRLVKLRRVYKAWAMCVENGGAIVIKADSDDEGHILSGGSSSDSEGDQTETSEVPPEFVKPRARRREANNAYS